MQSIAVVFVVFFLGGGGGGIDFFSKIMTISTELAISKKYVKLYPRTFQQNWEILLLFQINFLAKDGTSEVYIPVHHVT